MFELLGPKHVNPADGSICGFEYADHTWTHGDELLALFDIYLVWAFRYIHRDLTSRWPGYQSALHALERILEMDDAEQCGCNAPKGSYKDCCKVSDQALNRYKLIADYIEKFGTLEKRTAPKRVWDFAMGLSRPSRLLDLGFRIPLEYHLRSSCGVGWNRALLP